MIYSKSAVVAAGATGRRRESPIKDSINFRRHRNGCRFYREDWTHEHILYISMCLLDMPPETKEDEWKCMTSKRGCWRLREQLRESARERDSA